MNSDEYQILLAQNCTKEELKQHLKHTFLCDKAQVELVKRKDITLLKIYLAKFCITENAQVKLAEIGTKEMLQIAINKKQFCCKAAFALTERFMTSKI